MQRSDRVVGPAMWARDDHSSARRGKLSPATAAPHHGDPSKLLLLHHHLWWMWWMLWHAHAILLWWCWWHTASAIAALTHPVLVSVWKGRQDMCRRTLVAMLLDLINFDSLLRMHAALDCHHQTI